jgi:hypothetical protein
MKHIFWLFPFLGFFIIFVDACVQGKKEKEVYLFTSFHEPANEGLRFLYSEDGVHWDSIPGIWLKPTLGKEKLMRDPSIAKGPDGTYHLVWTTSWKGDLGFGYASSKDLIHWSEQRMIPAMIHEPTAVNVWAPEIFYDDTEKEFIIVWASCIPGQFPAGEEEDNNNHRLYYLTTNDFQSFSETKLFFDPGFSVIDGVIVKRRNDYVLVFKDNTRPNRNLRVAFAQTPIGPFFNISEPFTEEFSEGPTVAKVKDDYLIYFDLYREKIYGAVKTRDFIRFKNITNEIQIPQGHKHGTIIKVPFSIVENLKHLKE